MILEGNSFTNPRASAKQAGNCWSPLWGHRRWQVSLFKFPQDPLMPVPAPDVLLRQSWVQCAPGQPQVCTHSSSRCLPKLASVQCSPGNSLGCIHSSSSWSAKATRYKQSIQGTLLHKATPSRPGEVAVSLNS